MHSDLAKRFREDLLLSGKQPSTIACYRNAIAHLAEHFACSPEKLFEAQVRQYVLLRRQQLQLGCPCATVAIT
ncbi:MAG: phage integrase N-terminal SAM-like domain-containing protein [Rhodopirellula sp. JB055]|uniref:phage integrase N-terminal SAM-like domain-containing protein n=1 Tax=Rhodopirellula sp. JB055 TaxID=3342846 RepID=UPI00370A45E2